MKKISDFLSKNFLFLEVKISIYLNRRVFVMRTFYRTFKTNCAAMTENVSLDVHPVKI